MCGRYSLSRPPFDELGELLGVEIDEELSRQPFRPRYNVAPGGEELVVLAAAPGARPRLARARWGLGPKGQINVRAESTLRRPSLRQALATRRCLVPTDGFFEWSGQRAARRPIWFHGARGELVLLAGLALPAGRGLRFAILTTAANDLCGRVHDRMPAVLPAAEAARWLGAGSAEEAAALLQPAPVGLLRGLWVSPRANSADNDDPACLAPAPEPGAAPRSRRGRRQQLDLFGGRNR
jgi:putative SOS response-associated peptidase YedK